MKKLILLVCVGLCTNGLQASNNPVWSPKMPLVAFAIGVGTGIVLFRYNEQKKRTALKTEQRHKAPITTSPTTPA